MDNPAHDRRSQSTLNSDADSNAQQFRSINETLMAAVSITAIAGVVKRQSRRKARQLARNYVRTA
jgi:hypothetical protein